MQHDVDKDRFATLFSKFTGVNKSTVTNYLKEYPVNTIFEHPSTLDMNERQYDKFKSLVELNSLYGNLKDNNERYVMNSPDKVRNYFKNYHSDIKDKEYVGVSYLDTKLQVIKTEVGFEGTVNSSVLIPREVAKKALMHDANAVMLSHNHPSGIPDPSMADMNVTERVEEALNALNIELLDHVIIGDRDRSVSLKEMGIISEDQLDYNNEDPGELIKESFQNNDNYKYSEEKETDSNNEQQKQAYLRQMSMER